MGYFLGCRSARRPSTLNIVETPFRAGTAPERSIQAMNSRSAPRAIEHGQLSQQQCILRFTHGVAIVEFAAKSGSLIHAHKLIRNSAKTFVRIACRLPLI